MGPALDFSLESHCGIGGGFCVSAALVHDSGMNVGPALGVFMGPPDSIGYGPGKGTQYDINMGA